MGDANRIVSRGLDAEGRGPEGLSVSRIWGFGNIRKPRDVTSGGLAVAASPHPPLVSDEDRFTPLTLPFPEKPLPLPLMCLVVFPSLPPFPDPGLDPDHGWTRRPLCLVHPRRVRRMPKARRRAGIPSAAPSTSLLTLRLPAASLSVIAAPQGLAMRPLALVNHHRSLHLAVSVMAVPMYHPYRGWYEWYAVVPRCTNSLRYAKSP